MLVGYARGAQWDEDLVLQKAALRELGCRHIYKEKYDGEVADRPVLQAILAGLKPGDVLVVYRLDRLARSMHGLLRVMGVLDSVDVELCSVQEGLDSRVLGREQFFSVFKALACFEETVEQGKSYEEKVVRPRGKAGGRPSKLTPEVIAKAKAMHLDVTVPPEEIAKKLGISKVTFYKALKLAA